jgi:hypothetical protein
MRDNASTAIGCYPGDGVGRRIGNGRIAFNPTRCSFGGAEGLQAGCNVREKLRIRRSLAVSQNGGVALAGKADLAIGSYGDLVNWTEAEARSDRHADAGKPVRGSP